MSIGFPQGALASDRHVGRGVDVGVALGLAAGQAGDLGQHHVEGLLLRSRDLAGQELTKDALQLAGATHVQVRGPVFVVPVAVGKLGAFVQDSDALGGLSRGG